MKILISFGLAVDLHYTINIQNCPKLLQKRAAG